METLAAERAARISALAIGLGALLLGAITIALTGWEQRSVLADWWSTLAVALLVGLPILLCIGWQRAPVSRLRHIGGLYAGSFLAVLVLWPAAIDGSLPEGLIPWPTELVSVVVAAAAYAWPLRAAAGYMLTLAIVRGVVRYDNSGGSVGASIAVQDVFYTVVLGTFMIIAVVAVRRGAARLDAAADSARAAAAEVAAKQAHTAERTRLDALVHDAVMSILIVVARGGADAALSKPVARQAEQSLAELDTLRGSDDSNRPASTTAVADKIHEAAAALDPAIDVQLTVSGDPGMTVGVARTLADATAEAVRNSLRHADAPGRRSSRTLQISVDAGSAHIEVRDDGVGFHAGEVPDSRLGLAVSIERRLSEITGGTARVESRMNAGTRVVLEWRRPSHSDENPSTGEWFSRSESATAAGVFVMGNAVLAIANSDVLPAWWPSMLALALIATFAIHLAKARTHPLPWKTAAAVVMAAPVTATLVSSQLPSQGWPGYAAWHVGANILLLSIVAIRGRIGWAWLGFAALNAVTITWAAIRVQDIGVGIALSLPHVATMLMATLVSTVLTRAMTLTAAHHHDRTHSVATVAAEQTRQEERARRLAYLDRTARPMLVRITQATTLAREHRQECLLLEAELRDSIRGRSLNTGGIPAAARRARTRGAEVTLIDDGDGDDPLGTAADAVRSQIVTELGRLRTGRIVARVQPPGRPSLATIIAETPESYRRIEIDHVGKPNEPVEPGCPTEGPT